MGAERKIRVRARSIREISPMETLPDIELMNDEDTDPDASTSQLVDLLNAYFAAEARVKEANKK